MGKKAKAEPAPNTPKTGLTCTRCGKPIYVGQPMQSLMSEDKSVAQHVRCRAPKR